MLQVISVFSKCCCLSAKLCDFIMPLESFNGPTLAFDTWHSLQACLPFLAHEIFTATVPTGTLGQHLCSALSGFTALTSGIKKQSAREILALVKEMAKFPLCPRNGIMHGGYIWTWKRSDLVLGWHPCGLIFVCPCSAKKPHWGCLWDSQSCTSEMVSALHLAGLWSYWCVSVFAVPPGWMFVSCNWRPDCFWMKRAVNLV